MMHCGWRSPRVVATTAMPSSMGRPQMKHRPSGTVGWPGGSVHTYVPTLPCVPMHTPVQWQGRPALGHAPTPETGRGDMLAIKIPGR